MTRKKSKHKDKNYTESKARKPTYSETKADNESSAKSAEAIMDISKWIGFDAKELDEMNCGKEGKPFAFSDTVIIWMMVMMGRFDFSVRETVGCAKAKLKDYGIKAPSRSTFQRRAEEIARNALFGPPPEDPRILALFVSPNVSERRRRTGIDSTGLNLTSTSLWRMKKWRVGPKYRGWLKLHALTDLDTGEVLAWALTEENVGDSLLFRHLFSAASAAGHRMSEIYGDNAYDSLDNWKLAAGNGVKFVTKFKSNTAPRTNGCGARGQAARQWVACGGKGWAKLTGYGFRWKIECTFSDLKRLISESVAARKKGGWIREVFQKVCAFNIHKEIRADIVVRTGNGVTVAEV